MLGEERLMIGGLRRERLMVEKESEGGGRFSGEIITDDEQEKEI